MPLYTYACDQHGEFSAWGTMSDSDQPQACPECTEPAPRALAHPAVPLRLRFVGQVSEQLRAQIAAAGLAAHTEYRPFVPHRESVAELLAASALLMAVPDVPRNRGILPGKIFEYLAARKPILCLGPAGCDADLILRECQAGQALPYEDGALLRQALEALVQRWQHPPVPDAAAPQPARYARRVLTGQLAALVRAVANPT